MALKLLTIVLLHCSCFLLSTAVGGDIGQTAFTAERGKPLVLPSNAVECQFNPPLWYNKTGNVEEKIHYGKFIVSVKTSVDM